MESDTDYAGWKPALHIILPFETNVRQEVYQNLNFDTLR